MRRRHPDEHCGLCEAAPFRPCVINLPGSSSHREPLAPRVYHFQPAGFRPELPLEHRAKSSGALGTPERNHDCWNCEGVGNYFGIGDPDKICELCLGHGELTFRGTPSRLRSQVSGSARRYQALLSAGKLPLTGGKPDRSARERLSAARAAGKLGAR